LIPERLSSALTNVRALQIFQLLRQGGLILVAVLLAKSTLSPAEVGTYEMLLYVGYLLTFFWVAGALQALLSYYPTLEAADQAAIVFQAFLVFTGMSLACGALLWFFPEFILQLLVQRSSLAFAGLFALFLVTNIPASLQEYFYLLQDRPLAILVYGLASATAQLLAVGLPPVLGMDFRWSFVALAGVGIAKGLILVRFVLVYGRWSWSVGLLRAWWLLAAPLMAYTLLGVANQSVGPWMVGYFFDGSAAEFAIYRYGARELPLLAALTGAVASGVIPFLARDLKAGSEHLKKEARQLYHLLFPVSIVLLLTSRWWFVWVFAATYAPSIVLFNTFLLLTPVHLIFARTVLVARQDTRWVPLFALGSMALNIIFCLLMTPVLGMPGIALSGVLAFGLEKAGLVIYLWRWHGVPWSVYTDLRWWWGYTLLLLIAFAVASGF